MLKKFYSYGALGLLLFGQIGCVGGSIQESEGGSSDFTPTPAASLEVVPTGHLVIVPDVIGTVEKRPATVVEADAFGVTWVLDKTRELPREWTVGVQVTQGGQILIDRTFLAQERLYVEHPLADGDYRWRAVISPTLDSEVKHRLSAARGAGDSAEIHRLTKAFQKEGRLLQASEARQNILFGFFKILDGIRVEGGLEK